MNAISREHSVGMTQLPFGRIFNFSERWDKLADKEFSEVLPYSIELAAALKSGIESHHWIDVRGFPVGQAILVGVESVKPAKLEPSLIERSVTLSGRVNEYQLKRVLGYGDALLLTFRQLPTWGEA